MTTLLLVVHLIDVTVRPAVASRQQVATNGGQRPQTAAAAVAGQWRFELVVSSSEHTAIV